MVYPDTYEKKVGFDEIRTLLKGRCMSSLGTEWVDSRLALMTDYDEIRAALDRVEEFRRFMAQEDDVYEENFFDVRQALLRIRPERTYLEELDLFDLKRSLQTVLALTRFFCRGDEDDAAQYPALRRLAADVPTFPEIITRIDQTLNKYGKVKDSASAELLTIRHNIEVTTRSISHSLRSIITQAQTDGYIDRDVTPTLRDGRLVIPVAPALKRKIRGIIHDESATGKTVFIEPTVVVEANNRIRELKAAERREVIRLLQEIASEVRPHVQEIISSLHFLANIDFLRAVSCLSDSLDAHTPRLQKLPAIHWVQAAHPLLSAALARHGGKIVPLDIELREGQRILLISGPNAGGKSVCLKTIGLLQYMVQCGLPVPADESSVVGVFSDLFIDIGDEQSLENDLSTYSSHLLNMKEMMKHSNARSLLLIDEFGGGTEPQIGGAMAEAILRKFVESRTYGVITTHYQNLKHFAEQATGVVNGAMLYDRQQMQPLFVLQIGNPGSSFAVEIARKIGIPEEVIDYASQLVGKDYIMSDKYLQDIVRDKMYWENKRRNIRTREKQLEQTVQHYEEEMQTFQAERKAVMAQAKEEARQLLQESNAKIEYTIKSIREVQADRERTKEIRQELSDFRSSIQDKDEEEARIARRIEKIKRRQERKARNAAAGSTAGAADDKPAGTAENASAGDSSLIRVGDTVCIKGQHTVGQVQNIKGRQARVLFGTMFTTLPLERLQRTAPAKKEELPAVQTYLSRETRELMDERKLQFKPEIDVRGFRGEEALRAIRYFIDDAIQLSYPRVRILHGTGTGALRMLIRQYLSTVDGIQRYHDEHVDFGGAGITVVEIE